MDDQCSSLALGCYYQEEGFVEELKHSLLYSSLELEAAVISAHEEISRKDDEIVQLRGLIETIVKERDEFESKCRHLVMEKNLLSQQISTIQTQYYSSKQLLSECPSSSNATSNQHEDSSDSDDNNKKIATSPTSSFPQTGRPFPDAGHNLPVKRPLPEKGKFLQAIMEAGPLLQTLLLAGPLPRWQHPPPRLSSGDIPPVKIFSPATKFLLQDSCLNSPTTTTTTSSGLSNKWAVINREGHDISPSGSKHQKVCPPSIIDPIPNPTPI